MCSMCVSVYCFGINSRVAHFEFLGWDGRIFFGRILFISFSWEEMKHRESAISAVYLGRKLQIIAYFGQAISNFVRYSLHTPFGDANHHEFLLLAAQI